MPYAGTDQKPSSKQLRRPWQRSTQAASRGPRPSGDSVRPPPVVTVHTVVSQSSGLRDFGLVSLAYVLGGVSVLLAVGLIKLRHRGTNEAPVLLVVVG